MSKQTFEETIRHLALNDATVYAYYKQQALSGIGWEEMLEGLVTALVREKKAYYDRAVSLTNRTTTLLRPLLGDPGEPNP